MTPSSQPATVVGIKPWLPWPLSAWPWWTEPVRAERLAALRIGVALCLLFDVAVNYAPATLDYYGKGGLGDPTVFNWRFEPPRTTWSLLRGPVDGSTTYLSLGLWLATSIWVLGIPFLRLVFARRPLPADDRTGTALGIWSFAFAWYVAGLWARMITAGEWNELAWAVPLAGFALACFFSCFDLATRYFAPAHRVAWPALLVALLSSTVLLISGFLLWQSGEIDGSAWWIRFFKPWQEDDALVLGAMVLWIASAFLLMVGICTPVCAILAWLVSVSFQNANPYLDNAGDTIRLILLFYLMVCPCGAVWSIDAWRRRRSGPVQVYPWSLRLLFVQMIFIYWMNGLYKLFGANWLAGNSLYYVLGDVALTRFSPLALPLPFLVTRIMTWSVLVWELSFPVLVLWKWTRRVALVCGVLFHLGIFATMELGGFVPYALCLYLPLVAWERIAPSSFSARAASGER